MGLRGKVEVRVQSSRFDVRWMMFPSCSFVRLPPKLQTESNIYTIEQLAAAPGVNLKFVWVHLGRRVYIIVRRFVTMMDIQIMTENI